METARAGLVPGYRSHAGGNGDAGNSAILRPECENVLNIVRFEYFIYIFLNIFKIHSKNTHNVYIKD